MHVTDQQIRTPIRSLHTEAVEVIAKWLMSGRYPVGAILPNETEIGEELGISRTVVREATRTLVAKGMLQVRRKTGTIVRPLSDWSLFDPEVLAWRFRYNRDTVFVDDMTQFRAAIETIAVEICASNPNFDCSVLYDCCDAMEAALNGEGDWFVADLAFHRHLLEGTGNQFILHMQPMLDNFFDAMLSPEVLLPENMRITLPYHRAIADAIAAGDPVRSRQAMLQLVQKGREDILNRIEAAAKDAPEK
ncbi:FadR/GntR family transcriptional regulator [Thalassospira povalilytica]|uniref:FadR family transcriptional regulator n=1 Tax=Thalassospira povalilytica TaxID=732237 RepID=A0ABX4R987_9PROT|nr:FadR/GntR family transcriptional regulator [Thalassospira povalilytica]MEE3045313.1 FadR/GntR family transcriptional regulator [Pseudomonadota bacterium]PKR50168.1 FadR family transcriptional regulator [Thalassospira povalilytica]